MKEFKNRESEVLFQKLGETWYVFTEVQDDVIFSAIPKGIDPYQSNFDLFEVIEEHLKKVSKIEQRRKDRQVNA